MSLKTIPYMEVVYASCRKGIDAPYGGFCVKTHSEGMPRDVLEAVSSPTKVCSYDRPTKELPTLEELRDDPSLFFDHPAAWLYTPVTTEGGREVYVFARSVFVGVEYGFFDGSGQRRQGSNFVTHALVFEQPVPIEVMKMPGLFLPVSTDGEAYMEEMRELLCGEPVLLPPRSVEIESENEAGAGAEIESGAETEAGAEVGAETEERSEELSEEQSEELSEEQSEEAGEESGESAATLKRAIEALVVELERNERKKLIVRVESARTEGLILEVMRALPGEVAQTLFFTTNYGRDGLPYRTPVKVFFLNETYPENYRIDGKHIFVNLMDGGNEIVGIEEESAEPAEESVEAEVPEASKVGWRERLSKRAAMLGKQVARMKTVLKDKKKDDE